MAKRHEFNAGDWGSIANRLDEILCAHTGEDPFEEALKLLVAKLIHEDGGLGVFLAHGTPAEVDALLSQAITRWPGVLAPESRCRLLGPELGRCAELLRAGSLRGSGLVGLDAAFEFLVNKAAKGQKGQYFTPRYVVDAAVRMVAPQPGERVVDPACGSGAFLRETLGVQPGAEVYGFDQDTRAVRVARVMMAASGQSAARVHRLDSLARGGAETIESVLSHDGFDVVVTNPPFAGDVGPEFAGSYALAAGGRVERDVLFLERCVGLLRPGGRLAIVLPHNKVGSARWAFAREWLLRQTRVVGVVGLGRNTFQPHTSQKACVVVAVKRERPLAQVPSDEEVVFFVSARDGKDHRGGLVLRDGVADHDLDEAVAPIVAALRLEGAV